jgi:fimbrial isopeptide formation D2 family protein/LPXTG-motif cell wall-anchored protein
MKMTKRIAAAVAAMTMAVSVMAATGSMGAWATTTSEGYSITINNASTDKGTHTYQYAQLFTGTVDGEGKITNASFGSGVSSATLISALKTFGTDNNIAELGSLANDADANAVVAALSKVTDADAAAKLAKALKPVVTTFTDLSSTTKVPAGYYLINDKADPTMVDGEPNSGAKTAFLLKVVKNEDLTAISKSAAPTVDKQVYDNDDGVTAGENNGWGETADHAINEEFQFKLIATIPNDPNIDAYKYYTLKFTDTLGEGVVFDKIDSVTVGTKTLEATEYNTSVQANDTNKAWTLEIPDAKLGNKNANLKGVVVEVVYTAHLNEDARVAGTADDNNQNKVKLEYSNNPNYEGTGIPEEENTKGETPEDTVFVFTYKVDNVKVDKEDHNTKLPDAEFKVTKGAADGVALKFKWSDDKNAYVVDPTGEEKIVSKTDGKFNIIGLDAGTYFVTETKAPEGYNLNSTPVEIQITATHDESSADVPSLTLTETSDGVFEYENAQGGTLPETGGIGTTLFYVGGGAMAAAAGIVLVVRKRAKREQ